MIDKELEKNLYNNSVYDAWQFVTNTANTIETAEYCKKVIIDLIAGMTKEHEEWKQKLFSDLFNQKGEVKIVSITTENLPIHQLKVSNVEASSSFLLNKLTKDFFQYVRNSFDCMSQIANAALLANRAKKVDSVDFPAMYKVFNQHTYSQDFPNISAWYNKVNSTPEYNYIDAFCNRTKHTCDVYLKVSLDLLGGNNSSEINPFFRKNFQHDKQNIITYLNDIFNFVITSFNNFLCELRKEYSKKKYIDNRISNLLVYQQKMNDSPDSNHSVVFIEATDKIENLPDEIHVLLLHQFDSGEIWSKNCEIDTILVRESEHKYIGRYIADEQCGDDTLLKYRKYKKDTKIGQEVYFQAMLDWKKKPIFYKFNPYIDIRTVSDDNEFLKRIQIPF